MVRDTIDDLLAEEIGGRLVPEIGEDQIIPAEAVFSVLRSNESGEAPAVTTGPLSFGVLGEDLT